MLYLCLRQTVPYNIAVAEVAFKTCLVHSLEVPLGTAKASAKMFKSEIGAAVKLLFIVYISLVSDPGRDRITNSMF